MLNVVIIGGGAAGFMAAIHAKTTQPQANVLILEASPRCLAKVLISGGGRCNVTHRFIDMAHFVSHYPRGQKALRGVYSRFSPLETQAWFKSHGVALKTEADGRLFPTTDSSETVAQCLIETARDLGIKIWTKVRVTAIEKSGAGDFSVISPERSYTAHRVILATGSNPQGLTLAKSLGHTPVACVPSLFTFKSKHPVLSGLQGISLPGVKGTLKVPGHKPIEQEGPWLITHWGVSGPVVLRLSAWGAHALHQNHYQGSLLLDLLPQISFGDLEAELCRFQKDHPKKLVENLGPEAIPKRLWEALVRHAEIHPQTPWGQLSPKARGRLVENLKRFELLVQGKGPFKEEFVTAGGIDLKEVDMTTMASKRCPGLYFAGEILDVDGLTGGFNLQFAWSSGAIAGHGAVL